MAAPLCPHSDFGRVSSFVVNPKAIRAAIVQIGRDLNPLLRQSQLSDDLFYKLFVRENAPVRIRRRPTARRRCSS